MEIVDQFRPTPFYRRFEGEILLNLFIILSSIIPYSQYTFNLKYLLLTKFSTLLSPFYK